MSKGSVCLDETADGEACKRKRWTGMSSSKTSKSIYFRGSEGLPRGGNVAVMQARSKLYEKLCVSPAREAFYRVEGLVWCLKGHLPVRKTEWKTDGCLSSEQGLTLTVHEPFRGRLLEQRGGLVGVEAVTNPPNSMVFTRVLQ